MPNISPLIRLKQKLPCRSGGHRRSMRPERKKKKILERMGGRWRVEREQDR